MRSDRSRCAVHLIQKISISLKLSLQLMTHDDVIIFLLLLRVVLLRPMDLCDSDVRGISPKGNSRVGAEYLKRKSVYDDVNIRHHYDIMVKAFKEATAAFFT